MTDSAPSITDSAPRLAAPGVRFSPEFLRLVKLALLGVAILHLVFQFVLWLPLNWSRTDHYRDMVIYYDAAMRLKAGGSPYQLWPEYTPSILPSRFFYPPPFLLLTRPLAELPFEWFCRVWYLFLLGAFWVYAAALGKLATGKWGWRTTLLAGLALGLYPHSYVALGFGNFEPVMWACYGLAFSTRFGAIALAFATMMKVHPIWALCLVVQKEGKRAFFPALAVLVVGFGLGIWLCGLENSLMWWPSTSPVISQGTFFTGNISLSFGGLRVLQHLGWHYDGGPLPGWARAYLSLVALLAPLLTVYFTRKKPLDLRLALTATATILFSPLCWTMYIPLLFAPAAILYRLKQQAPEQLQSQL